MNLEIRLEFAEGKLSKETDFDEFKVNVKGQMDAITQVHGLTCAERTTSAPDGALGVEQVLLFVVENFETIAQISRNTAIIAQAVNSLTQLFIKRKKGEEDSPNVVVNIGDKKIELPANAKEIDAFVSDIRAKYDKASEEGDDKE